MFRDVEAILVRRLVDVSGHVATTHPRDTNDGWVRIQLLDGPDVTGSEAPIDHLIEYMVQVDCYAGDGEDSSVAFDTAAAVRASILGLDGTVYGGATFSRVRITQGPARIADTGFQPARQRYVLTTIFRAR